MAILGLKPFSDMVYLASSIYLWEVFYINGPYSFIQTSQDICGKSHDACLQHLVPGERGGTTVCQKCYDQGEEGIFCSLTGCAADGLQIFAIEVLISGHCERKERSPPFLTINPLIDFHITFIIECHQTVNFAACCIISRKHLMTRHSVRTLVQFLFAHRLRSLFIHT